MNTPLKPRKTPQRMCVACREMKEKRGLLRLVRIPEGTIVLDEEGKAPGRGAYLCLSDACLKKARKSRALERALGIKIEEDVFALIAERISRAQQESE